MSQQLEWEVAAHQEVERETIYLRERLRQRAEDLARAVNAERVTMGHVTSARRQRGHRAAPAGVAAEPPGPLAGRDQWPISFGAYHLGDRSGAVAIRTLASEALIAPLAAAALPGVAIIGRVFTENFGVEKIVTSVVSNPRLRHGVPPSRRPDLAGSARPRP